MDSGLSNAPALAFVKDVSCWLVVNKKCEPVMWIDEATELDWFFTSVLELGASETEATRDQKFQADAVRQISPERKKQERRIVLPMRVV